MTRTARTGIALVGAMGFAGILLAVGGLEARQGKKSETRKERTAAPTEPAPPLAQLGLLLDGFHYHDGNVEQQVEALHHCGQVKTGVFQCVLFDSTGEDARMIGIEYVVTEDRLKALPEEERALWHSHGYEVASGLLLAPGMPEAKQKDLMKTLSRTYGKTWHTWQTDLDDELPVGRPDLMMAFTRDGQAKPDLTNRRDREFDVSTTQIRRRRSDIQPPEPLPGVDRGEEGKSCAGPAIQRVKGTERP